MWFNAFSGRMYRDATSSILFREWFSGILFRLMNKGSKPGYIDEFQVSVRADELIHQKPFSFLRSTSMYWLTPTNSSSYVDEEGYPYTPVLEPDAVVCAIIVDPAGPQPPLRLHATHAEERQVGADLGAGGRGPALRHRHGGRHGLPGTTYRAVPAVEEVADACRRAMRVIQGGFGFKVATKLWLNWPKPGTAHLPIAVDIHLEELSGPVSSQSSSTASIYTMT